MHQTACPGRVANYFISPTLSIILNLGSDPPKLVRYQDTRLWIGSENNLLLLCLAQWLPNSLSHRDRPTSSLEILNTEMPTMSEIFQLKLMALLHNLYFYNSSIYILQQGS